MIRPLEGARILLAEDEALIALDVEAICLEFGAASVFTVRSAGELENLEPGAGFDAAILDAMLADRPTAPFAHRLLEAGIPFIFATGHSGSSDHFAHFPGIEVVAKPYGGSDLVEALEAAIRRGAAGADR